MTTATGRALVIGKFLPPHVGHHALIDEASRVAATVEVIVCDLPGQRPDATRRAGWLAAVHPTARIRIVADICGWHAPAPCPPACSAAWARHLRAAGLGPWDLVVTSEPYGPRFASELGAGHVPFDPTRSKRPVSATAVRRDLTGHWWALHPVVRGGLARRVVVVGAESTGTTTLARHLAATLDAPWVPEFGRHHTETLAAAAGSLWDVSWTAADFRRIADGQARLEDDVLAGWAASDRPPGKRGPWLVCDTDLAATSVWHERYLGAPAPWLVARAIDGSRRPDLYVLTTPDGVIFEQDGLRDGEHLRDRMTDRFRSVLVDTGVPTVEVGGPPAARLDQVLTTLDRLPSRFDRGGSRHPPP